MIEVDTSEGLATFQAVEERVVMEGDLLDAASRGGARVLPRRGQVMRCGEGHGSAVQAVHKIMNLLNFWVQLGSSPAPQPRRAQ